MTTYQTAIDAIRELKAKFGSTWRDISPEDAARMQMQNQFKTGLDIAKYTAAIMRRDMAAYDADSSKYTQSLGCWHGFIAQQKMIANKNTSVRLNVAISTFLVGWLLLFVQNLVHFLTNLCTKKTSVPALIEEIYTFLRQADAKELNDLFRALKKANEAGDTAKAAEITAQIDGFQTHIVPIIADIDAGFGNEEATYLLARKMIEAGACALQIENQVSDAKQCGHQAGKVTVPHEDFIAKIHALRYAFLEMGLDDGIIVARTDSEGADLTQKIPVVKEPGDIASQYISYLDTVEIDIADAQEDEILIKRNGKLHRPKRLASGLYQFRADTQIDRVVLDCVSSLQNGADLLWIETATPNVEEIAHMVNRVKEVVPNAKLVYNNSPSFNWTLNFRQQAYDRWVAEGKDVSAYDRAKLMSAEYDNTELAADADAKIRTFQADASREAGVFHHLITLPTYHTAALSTHELAQGYFGSEGMLAYVAGVQRKEIRGGIACVKHQAMAGSDIGDDHKEIFSGDNALKAHDDAKNTMNQFAAH